MIGHWIDVVDVSHVIDLALSHNLPFLRVSLWGWITFLESNSSNCYDREKRVRLRLEFQNVAIRWNSACEMLERAKPTETLTAISKPLHQATAISISLLVSIHFCDLLRHQTDTFGIIIGRQ